MQLFSIFHLHKYCQMYVGCFNFNYKDVNSKPVSQGEIFFTDINIQKH